MGHSENRKGGNYIKLEVDNSCPKLEADNYLRQKKQQEQRCNSSHSTGKTSSLYHYKFKARRDISEREGAR